MRQKIEEAQDNSASSSDSPVKIEELQEQIIESGAKASFGKAMGDSFNWETVTDRTRDFHKKHVEAALAAAEPHMKEGMENPKAVRAAQKSLKKTMAGTVLGSSYRFDERSKEMAQAILSETSSLRNKTSNS